MKNVHFAIPEIYGDSLSYYELLCKLVKAMNVVIDNYDTIPEQIADAVKNLDAAQLFSAVLNQLIDTIATDNTKSANAVKVYKKHDLLYATFNETVNLYEALIDFTQGTETELIVGSNIREVNISELFIELRELIDVETQTREQADTTLQRAINTEKSAREQADTNLQQNINTEVSAREQGENKNNTEIAKIHSNITAIENKNTEQDDELGTLRTMISSPYNFKGDVASISALPESGNVNDTYYVQDVKYKVTWTGSAWVQSSLNEADYQTELSELKGDLVNLSNNIIDVEWIVGGYIAYNTGGIQSESETKYSHTDYISLKENPIYSIYAHWYGYVGCAFYTKNKQFISGLGANGEYGSKKRIISIPENAVYIRLSNVSEQLPNTDTKITINNLNKEKNETIDYINEQIIDVKNYSDSMDNDIYKNVVINMIDYDDIEDNKYVNYNNGGTYDLSGLSATGYIEVTEGTTIILYNIQTASSDTRGFAYYNYKKLYVGGVQYTSKNTIKFTVPNGVKYIRATIATSNINNAVIYTLCDLSKLKEDIENETKYTDLLYKGVCIGDSLTVGADYTSGTYMGNMKENYPYYLEKFIGTTVDYVAHAGDSALDWYNSFGRNDYSSYDFAIVWLGTNGGLTNTSLTDITTNTGAYIAILDKLISDNPNIKIALCNCHGSSGNLTTTNQMIDSISQLSQYANNIIGVVDMFNSNLWSDEVKQLYHPNNNLHFSKVGNFHLANYVKDSINKLIKDNENMFNTLVRGHGA